MAENQNRPVSHEVELAPRHEPLDEQRMGDYLAGVGNHEGKALLLLALNQADNDKFHTRGQLHELLKELPGSKNAYLGNRGNQVNWCQRSLAPIGFVAREEYDGADRFAITDEGREIGVPLAGLLLDFSERHKVPLVELFGSSISNGKMRSPIIRLRMVRELLTHPNGANLAEMVDSTEVADQVVIEKHLRKLAVVGLIEYNDWDNAVDEQRVALLDKSFEPNSQATWQSLIVERLKAEDSVSFDDLISYCSQKQPESDAQLDDAAVAIKVSITLYRLRERGKVSPPSGQLKDQALPVRFTSGQEQVWTELLNLLEAFMDRDPELIERGNTLAKHILNEPDIITNLLNRSAEAAANTKNDTGKDLGTLVMRVLANAQAPLSVRDLVTGVSEVQGRTYSHYAVSRIAKKISGAGAIIEEKDKVLRYRLRNPQSTSTDSAQ